MVSIVIYNITHSLYINQYMIYPMVFIYIWTIIYVLASCPPLSASEHGQISYSSSIGDGRYWPNTKATHSCDDGYSLGKNGWRIRSCQASGTWNGLSKFCYGKYFQYSILILIHHITDKYHSITNNN